MIQCKAWTTPRLCTRKGFRKWTQWIFLILFVFSNAIAGQPIDLLLKRIFPQNSVRRVVAPVYANTSSYDFSDCGSTCDTDAGWYASGDDVDAFPFAGLTANRNSHSEADDTAYTALSSSDDSRYAPANPSTADQNLLWMEMTVSEDPATISKLEFTFEGYTTTTASPFFIYIKTSDGDYETDASWTVLSGSTTIAGSTETTITRFITDDLVEIDDYFDSNGKIVWAVYQSTSALSLNVDYVKMDVTHYPVQQEGFRFRNDDGSETTATWKATQDSNITSEAESGLRLRTLINSTGATDPDAAQYQLEYKRSTDDVYYPVDQSPSDVTPTIESWSSNASSTTNSSSHVITMPSGITAGDLLLLVFSTDGIADVSILAGDWIKLDQEQQSTSQVTAAIFYKFATGSDTATVATGSEQTSHIVYRISGASVPYIAQANGNSTNSNPPSLDTGVSRNYLWIATASHDSTVVASAAPSNYSNLHTQAAAGVNGASTSTAERALTASSEDPGTFTTGNEQWVSFTIAIPSSSMGVKAGGPTPGQATTSMSIGYPQGIEKGDLIVMGITNKHTPNGPTTPSGWTAASNYQQSGTAGTDTTDAGSVYSTVFYKIADGNESGNITISVPSGNATTGRMIAYKKEKGKVWSIAMANGSDTTANTAWSVTAGSDPGIAAGDMVLAVSAINTDGYSYNSQSMTTTGVTFDSAEKEISEIGTSSGNDTEIVLSNHYAISGTSSAAPVYTMTSSSSSASAPAGATVFVRIRQVSAPMTLTSSTNITAGGENTSALLTAPTGKSTSDFTAGRMQDDENPADSVNLSSTQYTELEWSIIATSETIDAEVYVFRITVNGLPIGTYSVTPEWTIGTSGSQDVTQIHYRWRNDDGDETSSGATWAESEDTPLVDVPITTNYRLRFLLSNEGSVSTGAQGYQLEVAETATCGSGTYAAVPTNSSGDWQIAASTHITDGSATTNVSGGLTDENTTFVAGEVKDTGNATDNITLSSTNFTEIEFSIQATSNATAGGDYCFRLTNVDTYTLYAEASIEAAGTPLFTLATYRFYLDSDSENVSDPWGNPNIAEDTALQLLPATNAPPENGTEARLRIGISIADASLSVGAQQFKLQYKAGTDATCTTGSWSDVDAGGGGGIWRYATSSVSDGTTLSTAQLSTSDILGVYAKSAPTTANPNGVSIGETVEYDFHIQHNGASAASTYSFRVVESDGSVLTSYTHCPTVTTLQDTSQQLRHGNVFSDEVEQGFTRVD